jgi:hypothetical protein
MIKSCANLKLNSRSNIEEKDRALFANLELNTMLLMLFAAERKKVRGVEPDFKECTAYYKSLHLGYLLPNKKSWESLMQSPSVCRIPKGSEVEAYSQVNIVIFK